VLRLSNVAILRALIATAQENHDRWPILAKIHAVARPTVRAEFGIVLRIGHTRLPLFKGVFALLAKPNMRVFRIAWTYDAATPAELLPIWKLFSLQLAEVLMSESEVIRPKQPINDRNALEFHFGRVHFAVRHQKVSFLHP
jgi:hypothetical protein